jgi:hypothetical protein
VSLQTCSDHLIRRNNIVRGIATSAVTFITGYAYQEQGGK